MNTISFQNPKPYFITYPKYNSFPKSKCFNFITSENQIFSKHNILKIIIKTITSKDLNGLDIQRYMN